MTNRKIWNFYLDHSVSDGAAADPEQESKILRYSPSEVLPSSWYLNKNILTVQLKVDKLKPLTELDLDKARKPDIGLLRLLSIVTSCERLDEELLNVEPLFLHPALIYFSNKAKILTLPFPRGAVSAGSYNHQSGDSWIFASKNTNVSQNSSVINLLHWIEKHYGIEDELILKLKSMGQDPDYRKLRLKLSELIKSDKIKAQIPAATKNNSLTIKPPVNKDNDSLSEKVNSKQKFINTNQQRKKNMNTPSNTDKLKNTPVSEQKKNKKSFSFFDKLRSRHSDNFELTEKTVDLVLEDPFFRMACLSEGLPGTKDEKLGHRAYILVDEFLIGRDSNTVDFWIDSQNVSRLHARIIRRQGSFFLEDLGSRNSTLLDGKKVNKHKEYLLPDKCRLTFADKAYYFEASS